MKRQIRLIPMKVLVALVLLSCPPLFAADKNDPVKPVNTATPQQQLLGDLFQILNSGYQGGAAAYGQPTNPLGQTNAGVWGTDEGTCTLFPDNRIFCIYGDTITTFWDTARTQWNDYQFLNACPDSGGVSGGTSNCLGLKAMSLIPAAGLGPADPSGCNAIAGVDSGLTAGTTPAISYSNCWTPTFITNSSHLVGSEPAMASQNVSGLTTDADGISEVLTAGHTPGTAFVVNGDLYIQWNVTRKGVSAIGNSGYQMESILMKCGPTTAITPAMSTDLACTRSYVWSQAPMVLSGKATVTNGSGTITQISGDMFSSYMTTPTGGGSGTYQLVFVDETNQQEYRITGYTDGSHITISPAYAGASGSIAWNVMQNQQTNIGKFIDSSTSVITVAGLPWASQLPPALQSATTILCSWGSSWAWRQSNLYLMCMDAANVDTATYTYNATRVNGSSGGLQQAYYLTGLSASGVPSWTADATNGAEELAIPLLTTWSHTVDPKFVSPDSNGDVSFNIGDPSVRYSPALQRFVLTYGSAETQGLLLRTSSTPWGPWSVEDSLLPNSGTGSWASKMVSHKSGGYRFNLTLPNNAPVACPGCTNTVATNVMFDATRPSVQVSAAEYPPIDDGGAWYAPYQYPVEHDFGNGTVGLYFHASAFNPYVPFDFSVPMAAAAQFNVSSSPTALTVSAPGGSASATITIVPAAGFSAVVAVSCTVAFNGQGSANDPPTCSVNPTQVNVASPNSGTTTLSISTTAPQVGMVRPQPGGKGWAPFAGSGGFLATVVLAGFLPREKPSRRTLLRKIGIDALLLAVFLTLLMTPGCGSGNSSSSSGNNNPGTSTGSYTVTLNASSAAYSTSISIPLTVQ